MKENIKIVNILIGPPKNEENDSYVVDNFMNEKGKKIVCGGTTSRIVSHKLNKKLITNKIDYQSKIPPIGYIDGIDLVTEGIITLNEVYKFLTIFLKCSNDIDENIKEINGSSLIIKMLLDADIINFYVGTAINKAHSSLRLPNRIELIKNIENVLIVLGKIVNIKFF